MEELSFKEFVAKLESEGKLKTAKRPLKSEFEAAGLMKELDGEPFKTKIENSEFEAIANVFPTKALVADYFGCAPGDLTKKMLEAIENPSDYKVVESAPCQEIVMDEVDLSKIPILTHCERDGGPYVASGVIFAMDSEHGLNASFQRGMVKSKDEFVLRILQRDLNTYIEKNGGELDVAYAIGNSPNVLLAAATSVAVNEDEMRIANSLEPLKMIKAGNGVLVPADSEIVIEGTITSELANEGPFVDLTGTYDIVRKQRVFKVKRITHRKGAYYHALLPGCLEHKILMGMPREPTIYKKVNEVCECLDVSISPGGCSWLHGFVKIRKKSDDEPKKAIKAAFEGHKSMKHVVIVDEDVNILDPLDVEWAISTRAQLDQDLVLKPGVKGSSLDPSANPKTRETCKAGLDATYPVGREADFKRAEFPRVNKEELV